MSIKAMNWVWDLDLGQGETLVLLALADAANDEGVCWPSQATVARKARMAERSARRVLACLSEMGLIESVRRSRHSPDGLIAGRISNLYRLKIGSVPVPVSAVQTLPAKLASTVKSNESVPVDNSHFGCSDPTGQIDLYGTVEDPDDHTVEDPGDLYGTLYSLNHHLEPPTNQPGTPISDASGAASLGVVGSEQISDESSRQASPPEVIPDGGLAGAAGLVAACLPPGLLGMDRSGLVAVAGLLRERLDAGWLPVEIRSAMSQPLPPRVTRMSGLVQHRLTANVDPLLAPVRLREARREVVRPVVPEPMIDPVETAWNEIWGAELERVRSQTVGLRRVEQLQQTLVSLAHRGLTGETFKALWETIASENPDLSNVEVKERVVARALESRRNGDAA